MTTKLPTLAHIDTQHTKKIIGNFIKSIWLFPAVCTVLLILLCSFGISGSSIGIFNNVFYGDKPDHSLIFGHPQATRSDEYNIGTPLTIAQSKIGYEPTNKNVGNGEDMAVLGDLPVKDWSTAFRPQNISFFFLPFDNAFALKWWLPGYLLVVSAYFFALFILPNRRLLAALLSSAFLFSPFFQWWYLPNTLGIVAFTLFGILAFIKILRSKKRLYTVAWSLLLAYISICFILFFYPPFQIACGLVALAFLIGYLLERKEILREQVVRQNLLFAAGALLISVAAVGLFLFQHSSTVKIIQNTAYPGTRVIKSGTGNFYYFLSSNTSPILEMGDRFQSIDKNTSKSEFSNFIIITPFLLLPAFYMIYRDKRNLRQQYIFFAVTAAFLLLLAWSFIPELSILGKLTLLDKVPVNRALLGIGLANFILLVILVDLYRKSKIKFSDSQIIIYSLLIVIFYLLLDMHWVAKNPGYLGIKTAAFLALPFPIIVFLFLKRWYAWALGALLAFTMVCVIKVNPLYIGTSAATNTLVSQRIQQINQRDSRTWVGDENLLENFPLMNGARSLSATYYFPQMDLWREIDVSKSHSDIYNRYAHVNFAFDRDATKTITPTFYKRGDDIFYVIIEACDPFLKNNDVGYIITGKKFNEGEANCATLETTIDYPNKQLYIYKLAF